MNYSIDFLNVGNITLCIEGKLCGTVAIPVIKRTVENDYAHIINGLLKIYIWIHNIEFNRSRGGNQEHNGTNHLFTPTK